MNKEKLSLAAKAAIGASKLSTTSIPPAQPQTNNKKKNSSSAATKSPYFSPRKTRNQRKHIQLQYENDVKSKIPISDTVVKATEVKPNTTKRKLKSNEPSAAPVKTADLHSSNSGSSIEEKHLKWQPNHWQQTLENIRQMRKTQLAPVDTMGCHKCSDDGADEKTKRYHVLIALMLSSQTKDQITYDAMNRLKQHGLTPENIVKSSSTVLEQLIVPVSFYKNKTKFIQNASQMLIDQYSSDIPKCVTDLIKLPGVGQKMAHICMNSAWNIVTGIGVDTHVHRISNRLHWVPKPTKEPEKTRVALEQWLPHELWSEVNELLVGFGQTVCTPTSPKCGQCINQSICPFVRKSSK